MSDSTNTDLGGLKTRTVGRRTVVAGAAWAAPAIAVGGALPAMATSPCGTIDFTDPSTFDWDKHDLKWATATATVGAITQSVDFRSAISGYDYSGPTSTFNGTNFDSLYNYGGVLLHQTRHGDRRGGHHNWCTRDGVAGGDYTYGQTVTLTFSPAPVKDVELTISGFTWPGDNDPNYKDAVYIASPAFEVVSRGRYIDQDSDGTVAKPFQPARSGSANAGANPDNAVTVKFGGDVSSITLHYWDNRKGDDCDDRSGANIQGVYISGLKFSTAECR